jgi:cytosine/adenosine deaminase-related metal-dependent hydrolase
MADRGVPLGLGVDGAASNDGGNLLHEARQALLLQRAIGGPAAFDPRDALFLATRGGAAVLGRTDCGSLEVGKRADIAVWDMATPASLGSWDLVAGLILSPPAGVRDLFVEGRAVVRDGDLVQTRRRDIVSAADRSLTRLKSLL